MHLRWFGTSWNAPVCDEEYHTRTPVGSKCVECSKKIVENDRGIVAAAGPGVWGTWDLATEGFLYRVCSYHLACFMAIVVGGEIEGTRVAERARGGTEIPIETYGPEDVQLIEEEHEDTRDEDATAGKGWH